MASNHQAPLLARKCLMFAYKWLVQAGYLWDWLLALALVIINFNVPGVLIPAVDRMYFAGELHLAVMRCCATAHRLKAKGCSTTAWHHSSDCRRTSTHAQL